jgi:hypothetical protein
MSISIEDKEKLFRQFKHSLGAPIRQIEIEEEQLCTLLEIAIENYSEYVMNWLIEHQWQSLLGQNITTTDMSFALSVRSLDYVQKATYAYSKQVGLQANGPWQLKKDYITIENGRQVYEIPAGREINEVLWITPTASGRSLLSNTSGTGSYDYGFGAGFAQTGNMGGMGTGGFGNNMGYYVAPAFDVLLTASDMNLKNRLLRSDLVYKITAGANGTKLLHLLSTPGSRFTFGHNIGGINATGFQVWYFYYDTIPENLDACLKANPDIIMYPNQIPLSKLDFSTFNEPTKILIRKLFIAEGKRTLGRTRGKFGGVVGPAGAERTMDYESLLSEGNEELKETLAKLEERLLRLTTTSQLERSANEAEFLNKNLKYHPLKLYVK